MDTVEQTLQATFAAWRALPDATLRELATKARNANRTWRALALESILAAKTGA